MSSFLGTYIVWCILGSHYIVYSQWSLTRIFSLTQEGAEYGTVPRVEYASEHSFNFKMSLAHGLLLSPVFIYCLLAECGSEQRV